MINDSGTMKQTKRNRESKGDHIQTEGNKYMYMNVFHVFDISISNSVSYGAFEDDNYTLQIWNVFVT